MTEYDVSVIVPVYNAEKYLKECIDSILNQTKDKLELVLVNDGSTDASSQIMNEYAKNYKNIVIVNQENRGLAEARIAGFLNAHGTYIGWVDADDFIAPQMYEKLFQLCIKHESEYVYCDYNFFPKKVASKEKWYKPYIGQKNWEYIDRNTQCWNTLTMKTLMEKVDICRSFKKFEEYAWISVMLHAKNICSTDEQLYFYRVGIPSMSGGSHVGKVNKFEKAADMSAHLHELIDGTQYEKTLGEYFEYRHIYTLLQLQIVAAINDDRAAYQRAQSKLKRIQFKKNSYTKLILDHNHGHLKSFVVRNLIPNSFTMAQVIAKTVF